VNLGGIDVIVYYQIYKPSANINSLLICDIKIDTGVSHKFPIYYKSSGIFKSSNLFS